MEEEIPHMKRSAWYKPSMFRAVPAHNDYIAKKTSTVFAYYDTGADSDCHFGFKIGNRKAEKRFGPVVYADFPERWKTMYLVNEAKVTVNDYWLFYKRKHGTSTLPM